MSDIVSAADLRNYQAARQIRHEAEYPNQNCPLRPLPADARAAIELAKKFRTAMTGYLGLRPQGVVGSYLRLSRASRGTGRLHPRSSDGAGYLPATALIDLNCGDVQLAGIPLWPLTGKGRK